MVRGPFGSVERFGSLAGVAGVPEGTAIGIWPIDGSTDGPYLVADDAHGVDWWAAKD